MGTQTAAQPTYQHLSLKMTGEESDLLINGFVATERISGLYTVEVDLLADVKQGVDQDIGPEDLIGSDMTVILEASGKKRHFHGVVSRAWELRSDHRFAYYKAELVPWLWLLQMTSNCRIFQDKTVPEILTAVFSELKHYTVNYRDDLKNTPYTKLDYCVQYRETDFNFVSRLMEREGIFYYFEHEEDKHTLVLADRSDLRQTCPNNPSARYQSEAGFGEREECVYSFHTSEQIAPGQYTLNDFQFQLDQQTMRVNEARVQSSETPSIKQTRLDKEQELELYDYPGRYAQRFNKPKERLGKVKDEGSRIVRLRMEHEEMEQSQAEGTSECRGFQPGYWFELAQRAPGLKEKYFLTSVQHRAEQVPDYVSGESSDSAYDNSFTCIPQGAPFRPECSTPRPVVQGPQTAIVVGKEKEEIWTDMYGRVKVQFHWDREGKKNDNSSCWVRVAQAWAGTAWGGMWIPRIGQEVLIEFLEGDPDQPIITGCVYNASHMPPYKLPKHQTRSCFKSRSSPGGGASNFNELRFEDKKGAEQIFFHAEKDLDVRVKNHSRETVGSNRHTIIGGNLLERVKGQKHRIVEKSHIEEVQGHFHCKIAEERLQQVDLGDELKVGQDQVTDIGGDKYVKVGANSYEKVGQKQALESGMEIHLKAGMKVVIEGGLQVTLKGPGGFVDIGPAGVTIQGTLVNINSGGAAGAGSGVKTKTVAKLEVPFDALKSGANDELPHSADDGKYGANAAGTPPSDES